MVVSLNSLIISVKELKIILIIIAILVVIIIFLRVIEKKLIAVLKARRGSKNIRYKKEFKKLSKLNSSSKPREKILDSINSLARDFFKEAFNLPYSCEYSELIEDFRQKGKKECISFCKLISELNYSGKEIEKNDITALINLLEKIISKNYIPTEEEKIELEKRAQEEKKKKEALLRKTKGKERKNAEKAKKKEEKIKREIEKKKKGEAEKNKIKKAKKEIKERRKELKIVRKVFKSKIKSEKPKIKQPKTKRIESIEGIGSASRLKEKIEEMRKKV